MRSVAVVLVLLLVSARAPAEDLRPVVDELEIGCQQLISSSGVPLEEVVERIAGRLRMAVRDASLAGAGERRYLADLAASALWDLKVILGELPGPSRLSGDPDAADVYRLLADLFLATDRVAPAMEAYRRADELRPARRGRCGIRYQGRVYTFEMVRRKDSVQTTPYLLIRDPATGSVLERFLLPAVGVAFAIGETDLHVIYRHWDERGLGSSRVKEGRLDRGVWVPEDLFARTRSRLGALNLAANFISEAHPFYRELPNPEFTPREELIEDLPGSLDELEAALRRAIVGDPTQPWHLLLLGQCLWAGGRRGEATAVWEDLFAGGFPATPYYEYWKMAWYFELYRHPGWADAALREAVSRRRNVPLPVDRSDLIERLVNVSTRRMTFGPAGWPELDVERAYLWWLRLRQISGLSAGDDFRAVLWANYFKGIGDTERASAELAYRDQVQRSGAVSPAAYCDYASWFFLASLAGLGVVVGDFFLRLTKTVAQKRRKDRQVPHRGRRRRVLKVLWRRSCAVSIPLAVLALSLAALTLALAYLRQREQEPLVLSDVPEPEVSTMPPIVSGREPRRSPAADAFDVSFRKWIASEPWRPRRALSQVPEAYWKFVKRHVLEPIAREKLLLAALLPSVLLALTLRPWRGWARRLVSILIPGAVFLWRGQLVWAYLTIWSFLVAAGPLQWLVRLTLANGSGFVDHRVSPGWFSFHYSLIPADDFALPRADFDRLLAENLLSLLWTYPHARLFYSLVALFLLASLCLHIRGLRTYGTWR